MQTTKNELQTLYNDLSQHLLNDEKPSVYLSTLLANTLFKEQPFVLLYQLKDTEQSPIHHPEGSAWNHTLLVVDQAAKVKSKSKDQTVFMWAALLHDIGKSTTTRRRKGRITSYDHDKAGETLAEEFLKTFTEDMQFVHSVSKLVRYHMHILFVNKNLPFGNTQALLNETDPNEVALLGYCDRMGRTNVNEEAEKLNINEFLEKIQKYR